MLKTVLETEGGLRIASGQPGTAILSLRLTQAVNAGEELTLGSVCAAVAEIQLITEGDCPMVKGDSFRLYKEDNLGRRWYLGVFTTEKPQRNSYHRVSITAYDHVAKLDKDLSRELANCVWPMTAEELASWVCSQCGVEWAGDFPGGERLLQRVSADGITGRQILSFLAEGAGRFCRADKDGKIRFSWYCENRKAALGTTFRYGIQAEYAQGEMRLSGVTATEQGEDLTLEAADPYVDGENLYLSGMDTLGCLSGKMALSDYEVPPPDSLRIRQDTADVGVLYPGEGENTYHITGNPFLVFEKPEDATQIAEAVMASLEKIRYTPMTVTVPLDGKVDVGDILFVTDITGKNHTCYVMERQISGHTMTLKCTGSGEKNATAQTGMNIRSLSGKVMRLHTDIQGLRAENADAKGNLAAMALTVDGIEGKVASFDGVQENIANLRQDAKSLELELRSIRENGTDRVVTSTGYTFSDEGLRIQKSGQEMENRLDHTGMTVSRSGRAILQADHRGVTAVDVTVGNFLAVAHARFESYENGTACFYI